MPLSRDQIAKRIAQEIKDGFVVNLGIGIPTLVANYISPEKNVMFQSENGLLGMGPFPTEGQVDPDLINAGKQTITTVKGASFFSSAESFAMIRGGHVDLTVLGAMEVDAQGNIANWMVPGKMVKGMGGAMDLVAGARKVVVAMQHRDKNNQSKILTTCTLPLTGVHCVDLVVTDLGVLQCTRKGFVLLEYAPDLTPQDLISATEAPLKIHPEVKMMTI